MSDNQARRLYEAMFLVDANKANQDWNGVIEHIHGVVLRHQGEIAKSEKWDERKLSYTVKGHSRATYLLLHFHALPSQLEAIRQNYELSDLVIRVLINKDEDGISSEIRSLPDEPTDPVRSTRRGRDRVMPDRQDRDFAPDEEDSSGDSDRKKETDEPADSK